MRNTSLLKVLLTSSMIKMIQIKNFINFGVGMILGVIGSAMWQYDKFLYYSVFCLQAIIIFILINSSTSDKSDSGK